MAPGSNSDCACTSPDRLSTSYCSSRHLTCGWVYKIERSEEATSIFLPDHHFEHVCHTEDLHWRTLLRSHRCLQGSNQIWDKGTWLDLPEAADCASLTPLFPLRTTLDP